MQNDTTLRTIINGALNAVGTVGTFCLTKTGTIIIPASLGYIGGRLIGAGGQVGALQGLSSGAYHAFIHIPFQNYVRRNEGTGSNDITRKNAIFFQCIGAISGIAVPFFITLLCAPYLNKMIENLPVTNILRRLIMTPATRAYGIGTAALICVAPVAAQHTISYLRHEDDKSRKL